MSSNVVRPAPRPLNFWLCLGIPAIAAVILLLLELTSSGHGSWLELAYDPVGGRLHRASTVTSWRDVLHDRAKEVVIALGGVCDLSASWRRSFIQPTQAVGNGSWAVMVLSIRRWRLQFRDAE
jgi:membrane-associated PAP2 superfamily phosphatase